MSGLVEGVIGPIQNFFELGGPVVALLSLISVIALALIVLKYWQFASAGVGRHQTCVRALDSWKGRDPEYAMQLLATDRSVVGALTWQAMASRGRLGSSEETAIERRLEVEAQARLQNLRRGFRALDSIAQITPLLGLFGTVLGMIAAFQALQEAGNGVDPSLLAGGIWVALLTTAVGLGVAMPTSLILTHLESRVSREAQMLEYALTTVLNPAKIPNHEAREPAIGAAGLAASS